MRSWKQSLCKLSFAKTCEERILWKHRHALCANSTCVSPRMISTSQPANVTLCEFSFRSIVVLNDYISNQTQLTVWRTRRLPSSLSHTQKKLHLAVEWYKMWHRLRLMAQFATRGQSWCSSLIFVRPPCLSSLCQVRWFLYRHDNFPESGIQLECFGNRCWIVLMNIQPDSCCFTFYIFLLSLNWSAWLSW